MEFSSSLVPIYFSKRWDTNYAPRFYDICQYFLDTIYFLIFKKQAPTFSPEAIGLIGTMGDWYVGDNFLYIRIWGSNIVHMLPRIVPGKLVLEEMALKSVNDGVYRKQIGPKKKAWPKFPLHLGSLVIPTSTWAAVLGEQIQSLKLGFSMKRKHDPKGCLDAHFK